MDSLHARCSAQLPLSDAGVSDPAPATAMPARTTFGPASNSLTSQGPTQDLDGLAQNLFSPSALPQFFNGAFYDSSFAQHYDAGAGAGDESGLLSDIAAGGWNMHADEGSTTLINDFFAKNGAFLPPAPCRLCQRQRLQCLILQTIDANSNPITSCSSCVALFRDCSLAERGKRQASSFETSRPVIGHLHGVNEVSLDAFERGPHDDIQLPLTIASPGRISGRCAKKTRPLALWFAGHVDHPYPTEDEKAELAKECGLNRTQVVNWFANARRRHRLSAQPLFSGANVFRHSLRRPRSLLQSLSPRMSPRMSPLECWGDSPPGDQPESAFAIDFALNGSSQGASDYFGSLDSGRDGSISSASGDSGIYHRRATKRESCHNISVSLHPYQSDDVPLFSFSTKNSVDGDSVGAASPTTEKATEKMQTFQCTFCLQGFRKRYDWVRHERSIHLPGLDSWICRLPLPPDQSFLVWRVNKTRPECIFCGESSPTHEHIQSHEFQTCAQRPSSERTFTRKDHLWQHLHKFHHCNKWEGWKPDLSLLQHKQDSLRSQCGFCSVTMSSWEERVQHLASHFRRGATMAEWTGGTGIQLSAEDKAMTV